MGLLDLLFPKWCVGCRRLGFYLCDSCFAFLAFDEEDICIACHKYAIGGVTHPVCQKAWMIDGVCSSLAYQGVLKKVLYAYKYKPYLSDIHHILSSLLIEGILQKEGLLHAISTAKKVYVMPIPLHKKRLQQRGYNQSFLLAKDLAKALKIPLLSLLERVKQTPSQARLSALNRKKNIIGAFAIEQAQKPLVQGATILLVDDVLTTGATLVEGAKVLKKSGATCVWGVTLARER